MFKQVFFAWHLRLSKLVSTTGLAQGNMGCESDGWAGWAVPYTAVFVLRYVSIDLTKLVAIEAQTGP